MVATLICADCHEPRILGKSECLKCGSRAGQIRDLGQKHDDEKPQWHLLPFEEVEAVVKVLTYGAKKYSPNNWKQVPDAKDRYFSAAMRHLTAWQKGEIHDKESGIYHLAHAVCCLLFLMWFDRNGR